MRTLIIAEKSEVGKAIDNAIRNNNYYPAGSYRVVSASGHLLELQDPENYDEKYGKWNLADLPIAFKDWEQVPKKDTSSFGVVKKKLDAIEEGLKWCDTVIHAGDPDDEGQLIIDELLDYFHNKKPVKRLDVNDSTEKYIIKMLGQLKDNTPLRPVGRSAYARTVADAMFGFNFSRYYTLASGSKTPMSIGRVQTPTLGLVVARDKLIDNHVQQDYYVLCADAKTADGKTIPVEFAFPKGSPELTDGKVLDRSSYDDVIRDISGKTFDMKITKKDVSENPPLPFNLVELQSYCSKFGITPEQTHAITQQLRSYALITYNRSSCRYLHEFQHAEAPAVMGKVFRNLNISAPVDYKIKSKCFNDKYLVGEPHHAIIPTEQEFDTSKLSASEMQVYKAICLYYIIQFLPPRLRKQTDASISAGKGTFTASAAKTTDAGFYGYMHGGKTGDVANVLNDLPEGTVKVTLENTKIETRQTKPPARYTQASLIKDMTCIAKYVKDPVIKQLLLDKDSDKQKENGSIGTPATRDGIVSTLIKRGFLKETGSGKTAHIESTDLGKEFYDMLPDMLKGADTTAEWWEITQNIQHGSVSEYALFDKLLSQIEAFLKNPPPVKLSNASTSAQQTVLGKCPSCGADIVSGPYRPFCKGKCGLIVFPSAFGKKLTENQITSLLSGKSVKLSGLKSKTGNTFSCNIVVDGVEDFTYTAKDNTEKSAKRLKFAFAENEVGECPVCGGSVLSGGDYYFCKNGCGFNIGKIFGSSVTETEAKKLLKGEKILKNNLFSKTKNKIFSAYVIPKGTEKREYNGKEYCNLTFELEFPKNSPAKSASRKKK